MSEAPERIWLIETDKYNPYGVSCSTAPHSPDESTEYVRADCIEALEREVERLRFAYDQEIKRATGQFNLTNWIIRNLLNESQLSVIAPGYDKPLRMMPAALSDEVTR